MMVFRKPGYDGGGFEGLDGKGQWLRLTAEEGEGGEEGEEN